MVGKNNIKYFFLGFRITGLRGWWYQHTENEQGVHILLGFNLKRQAVKTAMKINELNFDCEKLHWHASTALRARWCSMSWKTYLLCNDRVERRKESVWISIVMEGFHGACVGEARLSTMGFCLGENRWGSSLCSVNKIGKGVYLEMR